jgi:hypothetical protein
MMLGSTRKGAAAVAAVSLVFAAPGGAQAPQQQLEAAAAAIAARDWADALSRFDAVEAQAQDAPPLLARTRIRKAEVLLRLERHHEAYRALRAGLASIADEPAFAEDRTLGQLMLAEHYERELLYGDALRLFMAAEAGAHNEALKLRALRGVVQTAMFHDGPLALAAADRAVRLAERAQGGGDRTQAAFQGLRARVLLNLGRVTEARAALERVNAALGGFNRRVDVDSITTRGDIAMAALKAGDQNAARAALAYTGAGRVAAADAFVPQNMLLPPCGEWTGLDPEDRIVLQVAIGADGQPGLVTPVHASRQGLPVLAAAGFVRLWRWSPERLAGIGEIFRLFARIEVRCSRQEDEVPLARMMAELQDWLRERGTPIVQGQISVEQLESMRRQVAALASQRGPDSSELTSPLISIALAELTPLAESREAFARAAGIARANGAPPSALAFLEAVLPILRHREAKLADPEARIDISGFAGNRALAADAHGATAARMFLLWMRAEPLGSDEMRAAVTAVSEESRLPIDDPWRRMARRWLAQEQLASGREIAREQVQAAWGPVPPCRYSLAPRMIPSNASEGSFPNEALRWGFEGWVMLEYDVVPAGTRTSVRAVASYPPFVFVEAAQRTGARIRHVQSADGCFGQRQRIVFRLID